MIKNLFISLTLLLTLISYSQSGTASPYSFYGIGESRFNGNVESRSMGGVSMIPDSLRVNFQNPAGFANLKLTNFSIGASTDYKKQKSNNSEAVVKRTTLDYLALSIPLGKFGAGFGLMPYSSVGYKIESNTENNKRLEGWGGLNSVFLGGGYKILPNLTVGGTAYYNFGRINNSFVEFIPGVNSGSRALSESLLNGFNFNFGVMYQHKLREKLSLYSSLTYSPQSTLTYENTRTISTVTQLNESEYSDIDFLSNTIPITKSNISIGQKIGFGLGIGDNKKWAFGTEITFQDTNNFSASTKSSTIVQYGTNQRYSLGGYYTPSTNPYNSYLKRIIYRSGFVFEKTGLNFNSNSINDVGFSMGAGLPVTGSLSSFNIGLQFGKKGTTNNNLVQENYIVLNLGLSINDKWFVKSKYR